MWKLPSRTCRHNSGTDCRRGMATTATNRGELLLSCGEVLNQLKFEKPLPCHGTARWYSMEGEGIRREPEGIRQSLLCRGVVQLVRTPVTQEAAGSSPVAPANSSNRRPVCLSKRHRPNYFAFSVNPRRVGNVG